MKRISTRAWAYLCIGLLLVLVVVLFFVNKGLEAQREAQISKDMLSEGIVERWGAALPAGFEI